jgi:hypothetical protein
MKKRKYKKIMKSVNPLLIGLVLRDLAFKEILKTANERKNAETIISIKKLFQDNNKLRY